jgi:hypothetical protein
MAHERNEESDAQIFPEGLDVGNGTPTDDLDGLSPLRLEMDRLVVAIEQKIDRWLAEYEVLSEEAPDDANDSISIQINDEWHLNGPELPGNPEWLRWIVREVFEKKTNGIITIGNGDPQIQPRDH